MGARRMSVAALLVVAGLFVAACGGGGGGGGGGAASTAGSTKGANGAKVAPTVDQAKGAKGNVTFCLGKDTSGNQHDSIKRFNKQFAAQGLHGRLLEFPESADEQRNQFVQRQQAKSGECDVFYSDVIWTAEFAAQKWLMDMSQYVNSRKDEFIPSTLQTINFDGKYWGVPQQTDAGFLYYRTDQVSSAPKTWQQVYQQAEQNDGIVYQGAPYEGLTVDYLELAFAAGGKVLNADGSKSAINSPQNLKALQFMVDGVKNGAAPKAVTTYMEEPARRAFESGKATFMRNWPYAYALGEKAPKVKGKFKVAPLPKWQGGQAASILGGHNLVISAFSKNPGAALKLVDFATSEDQEVTGFAKYSIAPTVSAAYESAAVKKAIPFAAIQKQAVSQAHSRPVSPVYPQISQAIYNNVNAALAGRVSPADALKKADSEINKALSTF
jgi:multiple sugar transport system substrate-binding protein